MAVQRAVAVDHRALGHEQVGDAEGVDQHDSPGSGTSARTARCIARSDA